MDNWYWWMILGMGIATYLPRVLPLTLLDGLPLSLFWIGVLRNIPYAVLGALIFPAILYVQPENIVFGLLGALVAFALSWFTENVMLSVLGTIAVLAVYSIM